MKKLYPFTNRTVFIFFFGIFHIALHAQINFSQSELSFTGFGSAPKVTSLMYGPDGRLYVANYPGTIDILTVQRNGLSDYQVAARESLSFVKDIVNHDDNGGPCSGSGSDCSSRETTGLTVAGTASNPVIYVTSSDYRIGSGPSGGNGDVNLDTNSGVITRISWNGSSWEAVDLVRGLPRSEENHATNGLEFVTINGTDYLIVASGGITNGGSPSTNFVHTCEYALSGAILSVNLTMLESMPILNDSGRSYIYDLPTLDDPTRANTNGVTDPDNASYNGIDINDPWGGNDGLNQAMEIPGGPVQIVSPGYRNAYDLVVTESGALYVTDNGANVGWGGLPVNEGGGSVTNQYDPSEPGNGFTTQTPDGEYVNNKDHLELITTDLQTYSFGSFYGGHPNPIRANPSGAGLYTAPAAVGTSGAVWRNLIYDPDGSRGVGYTTDASIALPANWPPVAVANAVEGDFRTPEQNNPDGPNDNPVTVWGTNTNGIDEYTATNFGGIMQGDLIAGVNNSNIRRVELNPDGSLEQLSPSFLSVSGGNPLGITCNGDGEVFPGTIWAGTLGGKIVVFEPQDFVECNDPGSQPNADFDSDGYTNQDELDNGSDPCNGGSQPDDFDKSAGAPLVSDFNDTDDDADGILDQDDPFQLGDPTTGGSDAFTLPIQNGLFNDQQGLGGIFGLGMTGLMNNGDPNPNWLNWLDRRDDPNDPNPNDVLGGAPGLMTSHMTSGTANGLTNTQEKGYQYGVQVDQTTGVFTVSGNLINFYSPLQLYGNTAALGGELGLFIGDGTQSNFIKFVITADGLTALQEINDVPGISIDIPILSANRPSSSVEFYFEVDPSNGEVSLEYSFDGGSRNNIGTITAQGSILTAIQQSGTDLAVGFIGTSNNTGVELEGTWDFLNVISGTPIVIQQLPDLDRLINASDEDIDLNNYFDDDNGVGNLTYTVENNSNPAIGASIAGNILTISYPATGASSDITIRATDAQLNFIEQNFTVNVSENPIVLFRVNSGGPLIVSIDGAMDWGLDEAGNNSPYLSEPANNGTSNPTITSFSPEVDLSTTPTSIFTKERFDNIVGAPDMTYTFPVTQTGNYEVRLYLGEGFSGVSNPGERIFNIEIEGLKFPALTNIDLVETYGFQVGTVLSHTLNVSDGNIDIVLKHGSIQNPIIAGIEILDASDTDTPIYIHPLADQLSNTGQDLNGSLTVVAVGGDGNLQYSATGLPPGVTLEPTNGQFGGTINPGATSGSPYNVTVTVDDSDGLSNDSATIDFVWYIIDAFAYRINAGDSEINSSDIGPLWEDNSMNGSQTGENYSVNTGVSSQFAGVTYENRDGSIPAYIDQATFGSIFLKDRFDQSAAPEMEYQINLDNGDYVVNLFFANAFSGTSQLGQRVFDVLIEGVTVQNDLDLISQFGHQVGGLLSFPVNISDGVLNIEFQHMVENPLLNAIEVFRDIQSNPALVLNPIANQQNEAGEPVSFMATATGGDPSETTNFYIAGQPAGISINASTGLLNGTISGTGTSGGPNADGIHQVTVSIIKPGSAPITESFQWIVSPNTGWVDKDENENYTGRHECSFVQAGDKFYLMGGRENSQTLDIYDYTTNSWSSLVNSAPVEFNHYQATEYQGLIWVIGAFKDNVFPNEAPADFIWIFDPSTQEWIQGPEIPAGRKRGSSGLVVYNDKFYILAGNTIGHNGGYVSWFDEYDPATGVWTTLADAPNARDHFHASVIGDKLYAAGGRLSGGPEGTWKPLIPEVDVYDFITGTWSTLPVGQNIPTPRAGAATVNFNDKLVVIGGEVQNELVYGVLTDDALKVTEEYDPVTGQWTRLDDLNFERHGFQGIVSGNGIIVTAGSNNRGGGNQKNMEYYLNDNPQGSPIVQSDLNVPEVVIIADNTNENIDIEISGGNTGIIVRSTQISGANASDFSIISGNLNNALIAPNTTRTITIALIGTGPNRSALLNINYGSNSQAGIILTNNPDLQLVVDNPGNQYNYEGESVSLPIQVTGNSSYTYSASGLPSNLNINPMTGLISGIISNAGGGGDTFVEENGLVIIEAESGTVVPTWSNTNQGGTSGIVAGTNHFGSQNGGTIPFNINISTPGVYRFRWRNYISGSSSSDSNDNWLRFPNDSNVWFFGLKNAGNEASIIANLQGAQTDVVFPVGSSRVTGPTTPDGASSNGYFKVYRGGATEQYTWDTVTSDGDAHEIYVWFVNPGTYTMEISERSAGHALDRLTLTKVDGPGYSLSQLETLPESNREGSGIGAAANSPYSVEVTVLDNGNPPSSSSVQFQWIVGEQGDLIAVPEADPINGNPPLLVNFVGSNSLDDIGVTSYFWDFKDGDTSNEADPVHTFTSSGIFNVELTVQDGDGNTDTNSVVITVGAASNQPPSALAQATPITGNTPLMVTFTGSNSTDDTGIAGYAWDFKDGGTSTEADPSYTFVTPGTYDVSLIVTDGDGLTDTDVITITVTAQNQAPVAVAEATPVSGVAPLAVTFTGSNSTDDTGIVSYAWDFIDGGTSTEADPSYTFVTPGTYDVSLIVTDGDGLTDTDVITITVTAQNQAPVAVAEATPVSGVAPLAVTFTGSNSTDDTGIVSYAWDFIDGGTSTEADPSYTFVTPGTYDVSLIVTDGDGLTDTDVITITVTAQNQAPVAVAEATPVSGVAPLAVTFTGSNSTDDTGIVSYAWDFIDGGTSTEADPSYTFVTPGTYDVSLIVTDGDGLTDTDVITITVTAQNQAPVAVAEATPVSGVAPLAVTFTGSNSTDDSGIVSYAWDFIDGGTSTEADPSYTFVTPGTYDVSLIVTDGDGLTDTDVITITVTAQNQAPVAVAEATPVSGVAPLAVTFTGSNSTDDTGIVSYAWDFIDGGTSTEADPSYTFAAPGTYDAELTVTDGDGLTDTDIITITVTAQNQAPVAVAEATPVSGVAPLAVTFTGSNSTDDTGIVSYAWDFADGSISAEANPVHIFESIGQFDVVLTVTDTEGLTDVATITIVVTKSMGEMVFKIQENPTQDGYGKIEIVNLSPGVQLNLVTLHDSSGRMIGTYDPQDIFTGNNTYQVPVFTLRDGLYYVGLEMNEGNTVLLKLLVEN